MQTLLFAWIFFLPLLCVTSTFLSRLLCTSGRGSLACYTAHMVASLHASSFVFVWVEFVVSSDSHTRVLFLEDSCGITAPSSCHPSARLLPATVWHGVMPQFGCAFHRRVSFYDVAASFRESVSGSIQRFLMSIQRTL